ncbi:MAG TPA: SDR family oxidoreductase [Methylophilus sp.]
MAKVLIIGCGDLGTAIAVNLHQAGHQVIGVRKSAEMLPLGMQTIQADILQPASLLPLKSMQPELLIYCIAATAQSDENYHQHYVVGLQNVLATQYGNTQLQHVFFVSSTRVYGQHTDAIINEDTPAIPSDFGGERLLQAEQVLHHFPAPSTVLRLSGIYGTGRLYLINMARDRSRWPVENHWSNRIHRDDAAAFIAYLVQLAAAKQGLQPCYIVTDDLPTQQYQVLMWIAQQLALPVDDVVVPSVTQGKRLSNQRLRDTGFSLQYPTYQQGYLPLLLD